MTAMFGAHETAGSTFCHLLQDIYNHPNVMARLRQEQSHLVAKYGREFTGKQAPRPDPNPDEPTDIPSHARTEQTNPVKS